MRISFLILPALFASATLAACSGSETAERSDGKALKVDVVAPREPEIIPASGQLSVGELANSYDHEATMARVQPQPPEDDIGTTWNDDGWIYSEGTGPDMTPAEPVEKEVRSSKITKVPADHEG